MEGSWYNNGRRGSYLINNQSIPWFDHPYLQGVVRCIIPLIIRHLATTLPETVIGGTDIDAKGGFDSGDDVDKAIGDKEFSGKGYASGIAAGN